MTEPARVLFLCVENANRSQMAEAFARIHGAGVILPSSAGSRPASEVGPKAIAAMGAVGYDLTGHHPKGLQEVGPGPWDYVVTMGCGDVCPWVPSRGQFDWDLPDPKGGSDSDVALVRDEIERRVKELVRTLQSPLPSQ
jgi:protein-tyrosine-phosphatase